MASIVPSLVERSGPPGVAGTSGVSDVSVVVALGSPGNRILSIGESVGLFSGTISVVVRGDRSVYMISSYANTLQVTPTYRMLYTLHFHYIVKNYVAV